MKQKLLKKYKKIEKIKDFIRIEGEKINELV